MEHHPQEYGGGYPGYAPPGWGAPPPGYGAQGAPPPGYGAPPPGYGAPPPNAPEYAAPPGAYPYAAGADGTPAASVAGGTEGAEMAAMRSEIATLRAENGRLNKELSNLKAAAAAGSGGPNFYPPPYQPQGYGMPSQYGGYQSQYAPPGYGAPPRQAAPATLPMNIKNERGPKGANLAVFCIPNSYYDQQVLDLVNSYGNVIFCQVATHRDTGMSRGYAFVSYDTVESAEKAISELHNMSVEGRALRVELARSDKGEKPY